MKGQRKLVCSWCVAGGQQRCPLPQVSLISCGISTPSVCPPAPTQARVLSKADSVHISFQ